MILMEKDWTLVYTVDQSYKAELANQLLKENEITAVIMNKQDTAYKAFGEHEVYVNNANYEKARKLLLASKI